MEITENLRKQYKLVKALRILSEEDILEPSQETKINQKINSYQGGGSGAPQGSGVLQGIGIR